MDSIESDTRSTLLEMVRTSLIHAGRYNSGDVLAPTVILWTDSDAQWSPLVGLLKPLMSELLTLGEYEPENMTGPTIWLRCVIERALAEINLPEDVIPIIYMPNVSRQLLRAADDCPISLKPMVELLYRGTVWTQRNGKDWTVEAFLVSEDGGLGLDVARDKHTRRAMLGALRQLAVTPVSRLIEKRLEAEDFDKLMIDDTQRDVLMWLNDPARTRDDWDDNKWSAFCSRCKAEFAFDPEKDGELAGGEKLGLRDGAWLAVWQRFDESPGLYPGIPGLLRRSKPPTLTFEKETWPDENELAERDLRKQLSDLGTQNANEARERICALEKKHGLRRDWVWAKLEQSPLAKSLRYLQVLAERTDKSLGGDSLQSMADLYIQSGYLADQAVLQAMASVKSGEDVEAVKAAIRAIYVPWLNDTAEHFQKLVAAQPLPDSNVLAENAICAETGTCILFADALRYDLAQRLVAIANERKLVVSQQHRWAGLPTVTSTAKPAVSPIADRFGGARIEESFQPVITSGSQPLTTDRFRKTLNAAGYEFIQASETGKPTAADARGWTEYGTVDKLGHSLHGKLAARVEDQLEQLIDRIRTLLEAGWRKIRVVTDHGWLLVPGGLPSMKLPAYLTESRWSRCAIIKDTSHVEVPMAGWFWNSQESFAFGPGIHCFKAGNEYAHGGVSLQECLVPDLAIRSAEPSTPVSIDIDEIRWIGLRCRIRIDPPEKGVLLDIRTKVNDPDTSIVVNKQPKKIDAEGRVALLVTEDSLRGTTVSIVVIDIAGHVVSKLATTVGGEE